MTKEGKDEVLDRIKIGLEQIRPYLNADGGDITLIEVTEDLVVKVKLTGACGSCPMSLYTLKAGVEYTVKQVAPEVKEVMAVN